MSVAQLELSKGSDLYSGQPVRGRKEERPCISLSEEAEDSQAEGFWRNRSEEAGIAGTRESGEPRGQDPQLGNTWQTAQSSQTVGL